MRALLVAVLVCAMHFATAQLRTLRFEPRCGDHALKLGEEQVLKGGLSVRISTFRFYIGVPRIPNDLELQPRPYTYHLFDAADTSTWTIVVSRGMDHIVLGVDSTTSVSGAFGGDLDPTKGMYWAWNSGYINLKLEGTCDALPYANHEFELHLGGYIGQQATMQKLPLPIDAKAVMQVDVSALLAAVDFTSRCNVMSPGAEAVRLSAAATHMFSFVDAR